MKRTKVDQLYQDFQEILLLLDQAEASLLLTAEEAFRKNLLVSAASYFEREIKGHIVRLVEKSSRGNETIVAFVRNKAIERQYHTYFQWEQRNANSFFGLFGEGFKSFMVERVRQDLEYENAVHAFLELGKERNRLVHQNFGGVFLEKTSEEIFCLYRTACAFVNSLEESFDEYLETADISIE